MTPCCYYHNSVYLLFNPPVAAILTSNVLFTIEMHRRVDMNRIMPIQFLDVYSPSHFINITDNLRGRLATERQMKAFPAAVTSSKRHRRQFISPLSRLQQPRLVVIACRMSPGESGQGAFFPVIRRLSFIMRLVSRVSLDILQIMCR